MHFSKLHKHYMAQHQQVGFAYVAEITLVLQDRPFRDMLLGLEAALAHAIELDCVPNDVLYLKGMIGKWKGDVIAVEEAASKFKTIENIMFQEYFERIATGLKSGEIQAVDLTFVPVNETDIPLSDEEKLAEIEKSIMEAITDLKAATAAGDEFAREEARTRVKTLKKERKALKKTIEEKEKEGSIDTAKVDALKAKIEEASARQTQAMMDDDDEAEEAAEAEIKELMKELSTLTGGSIPKKKLEDAKSKDAQLNK